MNTDIFENKSAVIGVLGLGYVGLPLAVYFAEAGFSVVGFDPDEQKRARIIEGDSYINDIPSSQLKNVTVEITDAPINGRVRGKLVPADGFQEISDCDVVIICVPTPLAKTKDPNLSYVVDASEVVSQYMKPGQLVVLESTTYPGTTRELILPRLEKSNGRDKEVGKDFYLAYSPERVDPGNEDYTIKNTPKVIGGVTRDCVRMATALYSQIVNVTVPVSSPDAAELSKLLENTFRLINIGLVNEFSIMCSRLGVDVWEVIDAAATKPFGFIPFYPGPGLGGHCIPVDPHYLSWRLKLYNYRTRFIELASEVNASMPSIVVDRIAEALNTKQKALNGSRVLVLGVAYKKDIDDVRESPAFDVIDGLVKRQAEVNFVDPHVDEIKLLSGEKLSSRPYSEAEIGSHDCVVLITDHSDFNAAEIVTAASLIVDTRNYFTKAGVSTLAGEKLYKL